MYSVDSTRDKDTEGEVWCGKDHFYIKLNIPFRDSLQRDKEND